MPYIPMETTFIPNTTTYKFINSSGVHTMYRITPNDGYVLHDRDLDVFENYDENGNGIGEPITLGFYAGNRTVSYDYDFVANPREFYAVLESEVPEGAEIFNIEPEHEVM